MEQVRGLHLREQRIGPGGGEQVDALRAARGMDLETEGLERPGHLATDVAGRAGDENPQAMHLR